MRKLLICAAVVAATWAGPFALRTPLARTAAPAASGTARVIVKYRADSTLLRKQALSVAGQNQMQASALGQRIGFALETGRGLSERSHVVFGHGLTSQQLAARIAAESDIEYAVPDERKHVVAVPNDAFYLSGPTVGPTSGGPAVGQWYLRPQGAAGTAANTAPASINAEQAWDITKGSASVVVAVVDTGVRFDHSDLQGGNVLPGYDMILDDPSSADGEPGRDSDASDPGDFVTAADVASGTGGCTSADIGPSSWHGTQTLGLIGAATDNGVGIASVSHGGVKVMPVRVLGKCGGFDSDIQAGILWAAGIDVPSVPHNANPARVINMSLGGVGACTQGYIDAIGQANAAGAVVVVSAGNSGGNGVSNPANCPGAIGVTGLRHAGDKVGYSDLGPEITISAPGGNCVTTTAGSACLYPIMTTTNTGVTTPVPGPGGAAYTDSFNSSLGTSFSAPLVSGTVALMLSVQPALTPVEVKSNLQASARAFPNTGGNSATIPTCTLSSTSQDECYCPNPGPGVTTLCGAGMLDARAAVRAASGTQARISLTTTTPTANQAVALTSTSIDAAGTIASYQWTILNAGTTGATVTGANQGASVVVTPTAAGSFVIQLTATDTVGSVSTTTLSVAVVSGTATPPASSPTPTSSGGGGGAVGAGWLALLLAAVLALAATAPRARRSALSVVVRGARKR